LAVLSAFTASNKACSQVAASPLGGGGAATTVTVTGWVTVPAALVADRVKMVVEAGLAGALPEAGREPIPGDMLTDVTPVTFQVRLEFPPGLMLEGLAVKEKMTGKVVGGRVVGGKVVGGKVVGGKVVGGRVVGGRVVGGKVVGGKVVGGEVTSIVTD